MSDEQQDTYVYLVYTIEDSGLYRGTSVQVSGVFDSPEKAHVYADMCDKNLTWLERKSIRLHVEGRKVQ